MRVGKGRLALLALVLAGVVAGVFYWRSDAAAPKSRGGREKSAVPVVAGPVRQKDVPVYLDGLGTVQGFNTVTIRSRIDGELVQIAFKEGQDVHAGDLLARIDPRTYEAQLAQAQAAKAKDEAVLENARRDLERYASLGNRVSGQIADTQRATVKQQEATIKSDQAAIDNARTLLSYTNIISPIDGRTGLRQVDLGNVVHAGDANGLVVVTQIQPISVIFTLPQQNLQAILGQMRAQGKLPVLAMGSDNRTPLDEGGLDLIDNLIDTATGSIRLKASFPNRDRLLWPGGFVNARLLLQTRLGVPVVPAQAIQHGPKGAYVFVVQQDNVAAMRPVTVSFLQDDDAVIETGLKVGDVVVIEGSAKLQEGSRVNQVKTP